MKKLLLLATILLFAATILAGNVTKTATGFKQQQTSIAFTQNKGQVHDQNYKPRPDVLYGVMTGNMAVHIKNNGVSYQLYRVEGTKGTEGPRETKGIRNLSVSTPPRLGVEKEETIQTIYRIDLTWLNANTNFTTTEDEALPGYNNYYLESCPNGALNVKSYKGITLYNLYKGINLHYYEKNGNLKHDYIVAPHTDYKQIHLRIEGAEISVNKDGSVLLSTPLGKVHEGAPIVYQNGKQLKAKWILENNILCFDIQNYNPNYELMIDPVTRMWGTYYGGGGEEGRGTTTDASGNVYMAGGTALNTSTVIATSGSHQTTLGGIDDAFLAKFTGNGIRLWGTYYGGTGTDRGQSCATDASGNVYLAGYTASNNGTVMATAGNHQPAYGGGTYDGFLVKFNSSGIRQWGTYYGGTGDDWAYSCATDASSNVYLAGYSNSSTGTVIATAGSHQSLYSSNTDAFLIKFNTVGVRLWGTYYGGVGGDLGNSCTTDASGNVYLLGNTTSSVGNLIATSGGHQTVYVGGGDAFLVKFSSAGIRQWGTYYGGTAFDDASSCATDVAGNVYLFGNTRTNTGTVIATPGSHQPAFGGGSNVFDAYLVKFDAVGNRQWGTYYGGTGDDVGYSCVTDALGNVYITGSSDTNTGTVIATTGSHQSLYGSNTDAFLIKFNGSGVRQWGTYYGGTGYEFSYSCSSDPIGNIYITGRTSTNSGTTIATPGSHQSAFSGPSNNSNAFLAKFDVCDVAPVQPASFSGPGTVCSGLAATFTTPVAYGANFYTLSLPSGSISSNTNSMSVVPQTSGIYTLVAGNACGLSPQQTLNVVVNITPTISVNSGSICSGQSFTINAGGAATYTYSGGQVVSPVSTSSYSVTGTSTVGCVSSNTAISTIIVNPLPIVSLNSGAICLGQSFTLIPGGAATYTFSGGPVVSPTVTSSYSVTGSSAQGCLSSNTAVTTITVSNIHPTISVNSGSICQGKTFTITPSGAATYTIQGGNALVTPASTSNYTVAGTSTAGCVSSNTAIASVTVNPLPTITVLSSSTLICEGETATLTAGGASSYTFNPGGAVTGITISPNTTTTYTITGTDANGCSNKATITQSVDACLGIRNEKLKIINEALVLYPNPTSGIINLESRFGGEIIILNALGQQVYSSKLVTGQQQINLEHLAKGVYILRIENNENSKTIKVIKE